MKAKLIVQIIYNELTILVQLYLPSIFVALSPQISMYILSGLEMYHYLLHLWIFCFKYRHMNI